MKKLLIILSLGSFSSFAQTEKFIVEWTIIETVQISCPNSILKDEYGRKTNGNYTTMAYCTQDVRVEHSRRFYSKDEACVLYEKLVESKESKLQVIGHVIEKVVIIFMD